MYTHDRTDLGMSVPVIGDSVSRLEYLRKCFKGITPDPRSKNAKSLPYLIHGAELVQSAGENDIMLRYRDGTYISEPELLYIKNRFVNPREFDLDWATPVTFHTLLRS